MDITLYHNPRCSKSRATLELLEQRGVTPRIVEYLEHPPGGDELRSLLRALGMRAGELARRKEQAWTDAGLDDDADDEAVIRAMLEHPILIERPIAVRGERAVIGRPPENVLALLDD